ncbi:hypothetical protein KP78_17450 [Jeotgalibacillus soli]|uniref:Uncharacterized protein n=1 Tax=Jeotgalibacillus soli TaxID=889306 RepID=A0A0C2VWD7_9BACL|nr:hypothetical protein KP78_17450 [Jeotgalibacillus soli]
MWKTTIHGNKQYKNHSMIINHFCKWFVTKGNTVHDQLFKQ